MIAVNASSERAFVILDPDPRADCAAVDTAREEMDRSGSCSAGGCGEIMGSGAPVISKWIPTARLIGRWLGRPSAWKMPR
jgi:hypothetical protein